MKVLKTLFFLFIGLAIGLTIGLKLSRNTISKLNAENTQLKKEIILEDSIHIAIDTTLNILYDSFELVEDYEYSDMLFGLLYDKGFFHSAAYLKHLYNKEKEFKNGKCISN